MRPINGDNSNNSWAPEYSCTKENYVDLVLIIADLYSIINKTSKEQYENICDMLSSKMEVIFQVSIQPYKSFEEFQETYRRPNSPLSQRFVDKLKIIQETTIPIVESYDTQNQLQFDLLVKGIEDRLIAEQLASIIIPLLRKR